MRERDDGQFPRGKGLTAQARFTFASLLSISVGAINQWPIVNRNIPQPVPVVVPV